MRLFDRFTTYVRVPSVPHGLPQVATGHRALGRWLVLLLGVAVALVAGHTVWWSQRALDQGVAAGYLATQWQALERQHIEIARGQQQAAAETRAAWHRDYLDRQVALVAWRQALARRISQDYGLAPQAAMFLVSEGQQAAEQHHVDPVLLLAVVSVESRFNPYVMSSSGAIGLTQTMPSAHPSKIQIIHDNGNTLIDPAANLRVGASILAEYLRWSHGDIIGALQQYNGARGDKTAKYAHKVLRNYDRLRAQLPALPDGPSTPYPPAAESSRTVALALALSR